MPTSLTGLTRQQFKDRLDELVTISQYNPRPWWWPISGETGWPLPYYFEDCWVAIDLAKRGWDTFLGPLIVPPISEALNDAWEALKSWFSSLEGEAQDADDIADKIEEWCAANNETPWEV